MKGCANTFVVTTVSRGTKTCQFHYVSNTLKAYQSASLLRGDLLEAHKANKHLATEMVLMDMIKVISEMENRLNLLSRIE